MQHQLIQDCGDDGKYEYIFYKEKKIGIRCILGEDYIYYYITDNDAFCDAFETRWFGKFCRSKGLYFRLQPRNQVFRIGGFDIPKEGYWYHMELEDKNKKEFNYLEYFAPQTAKKFFDMEKEYEEYVKSANYSILLQITKKFNIVDRNCLKIIVNMVNV
jgi:hypothetical protein